MIDKIDIQDKEMTKNSVYQRKRVISKINELIDEVKKIECNSFDENTLGNQNDNEGYNNYYEEKLENELHKTKQKIKEIKKLITKWIDDVKIDIAQNQNKKTQTTCTYSAGTVLLMLFLLDSELEKNNLK